MHKTLYVVQTNFGIYTSPSLLSCRQWSWSEGSCLEPQNSQQPVMRTLPLTQMHWAETCLTETESTSSKNSHMKTIDS